MSEPMSEKSLGFTIKVVAERTGISVHTLRAWERRYGIPKPKRDHGSGYRLYDEQDIADLLWLKRQVDSGISPAQASAILHHERGPLRKVTAEGSGQPLAATCAALQEAFHWSDQAKARQILDEAFASFTPEHITQHIVEPLMRDIGDKWMRNEMSVAQEHLASQLVQQRLAAVLQAQPALPHTAPSLIAACAPNEEHSLGLLTFSLMARRQGWRVAYLGQAVPLADIRDLAARTKPEVIGVSVTTVIGLANLIPWLDPAQRPACKLIFGGRMPNLLSALRERLPGEYLGDDALTAARGLVSTRSRRDYWSPSSNVRKAVNALSAHRLKIAGDSVVQVMSSLPPLSQRKWSSVDLNHATLFLLDALLSALAFEVPDLMEFERRWLEDAMPPRQVGKAILQKHFDTVADVMQRVLPKEQNRHYRPLLDRMKHLTAG